jgi:alkylation response protein AidB-like acyl-CoA dehydrogenase
MNFEISEDQQMLRETSTRATRDGDGWRIDGQKMFTGGADIADYMPRSRG